MSVQPAFMKRTSYYGWLPQYLGVHREFFRRHVSRIPKNPNGLNPAVAVFQRAIQRSPVMRRLFNAIFDQVNKDPKWQPSQPLYIIKDFDTLMATLSNIVDGPPRFIKLTNQQGEIMGEPVGVPIYLALDLLSNTSAAYDLFRMPEFNVEMKKLLNAWGAYLESDKSNTTLNANPDGWYSPAGMTLLTSCLGGLTFTQTYQVDPKAGEALYRSWDAFFTRRFNPLKPDGTPMRPIVGPGILPVIYNPCESTIFRTASNVQLHDTFWLKTQNYSLFDMLGGTDYPDLSRNASDFVGGSVIQAFLSPQDYHRWHCPVNGKVTTSVTLEGTYYAVLPDEGAPSHSTDLQPGDPHGAIIRSQAWLTVSATRAVFIIEPTDPVLHVKRICFIAVGMVEVSTCKISVHGTPQKPAPVKAGDELGTFRFGGSSFAMIIQPEEGYEVLFQDQHDSPIRPDQHRWINSIIASVQKIQPMESAE